MKKIIVSGVAAVLALLLISFLADINLFSTLPLEAVLAALPLAGVAARKPMDEVDFQDQVLNGVSHIASRVRSLEERQTRLLGRGTPGRAADILMGNPVARENFKHIVLRSLRADEFLPAEIQKTLGTGTPPGSTLVTEELHQVVYDTLLEYGQFRTLGIIPMGTIGTKLFVPTARPVAGFIKGGQPIPKDENLAINQPELEAKKIATRIDAELELLQDAKIPFEVMLFEQAVQSLAQGIDYAVFRGNGADDAQNGAITGVFEGATVVTAAAGHDAIGKLDFSDFLAVLSAVDPVVLSRNARWWMHPSMLPYILGIRDDNSRPIFLPASDAPTLGGLGTIMGFPVSLVGVAPFTNGASQKVCAFGDPEAYAVGLRQDFTFDGSDHFLWNSFSRCFRAIARVDGVFRRTSGMAVLRTAAV